MVDDYETIDSLSIDASPHKRIGMRVVSESSSRIRDRRPYSAEVKWPEDELFDPSGITREEACAAAELCAG